MFEADTQLISLINKWQEKLKLNHWKIEYKLVDSDELGGNHHGKTRIHLYLLRAEMLFITEESYNKGGKNYFIREIYDLEETVVHEMVHLILAEFECDKESIEEPIVNILTRIILEQEGQYQDMKKLCAIANKE